MSKSYEILVTNVKKLLVERSWTQEKLGDEAGVSQERISNLLNGKNEPTLLLVDKLSVAFGVSTVELLSENTELCVLKESEVPYQSTNRGVVFTKYGKTSKVKNVSIHIPNLQKFREEFIKFNYDVSNPKSGKANSYANYMEYLLQNYYDNFDEVLNPFERSTLSKIEKLRENPNFKIYNLDESRFPNATIESYIRFINSIK